MDEPTKPTIMSVSRIAAVAVAVVTFASSLYAQPKILGSIDFPNSGAPAAQADFIQGMLLMHSFEYYDAAEAFRRAREKDPGFGMAFWGEAMTYNHPVWMQQQEDAAQKVLSELGETVEDRSKAFPTDREQAYHMAVETLYGNTPESAGKSKEERDDLYSEVMRQLHDQYPDDDEATTLYALSILGTAHEGRDFRTYMRAAAVAFQVWEKNKLHPGAAHYLIHSFDDPIHAPLGLPMARAYSKIAPSAAHAQHMTSHIFVAMGMWDETVKANEVALGVQNARYKELGRSPNVCGHYAYWLEYGYIQQGRLADAGKMLEDCAARMNQDPSDGERGYFAVMRARYVIDTGAWSDANRWTTEYGAGKWGGRDYEYTSALAEARLGNEEAARQHLELLRQKSDDDDDVAPILDKQINAILTLTAGDTDAGIDLLNEAATLESELPLEFGPPEPVGQSYELLGLALLDLGRYDEALKALQTQILRTPGRASTLQALQEAKEALSTQE